MDAALRDKILGVMFGCAIGDALGLGTEFMTREDVQKYYPHGLTEYGQMIQDRHRSSWKPGEWTDDTEMMLCITRALVQEKRVDLRAIAKNFKQWFNSAPRGIGKQTYRVLQFKEYVEHPQKAAEAVWKQQKQNLAGNGGLMRTAVLGLWPENVESYAAEVCRLTHADPRCVGSCVIVSELIHAWAYRREMLPMRLLEELAAKYDARIQEYLRMAAEAHSLEELNLDDESRGYTLKTMAAALWAMLHAESFEQGLLTVVNAGGDADTNAAVACSLLGAKFGFSTIPQSYVEGLCQKQELLEGSESFMQVLPL